MNNSTESYEALKGLFESLEKDFSKFSLKNNKASCTRCRKQLMDITKISKVMRKQLIDEKKSLPVKKKKVS